MSFACPRDIWLCPTFGVQFIYHRLFLSRLSIVKANVFVKPNEQNRIRSSYTMARKGAMKWSSHSVFATPKIRACKAIHNKFVPKSEELERILVWDFC